MMRQETAICLSNDNRFQAFGRTENVAPRVWYRPCKGGTPLFLWWPAWERPPIHDALHEGG
jgi:hypothetical protein